MHNKYVIQVRNQLLNSNYIHIHKRTFFNGLFLVLVISAVSIGVWGYRYYKANIFDSSLNGSEASEVKQSSIPPDVAKARLNDTSLQRSILTSQTKPVPTSLRVPILMYHYVEYVKDPGDKTRISLNTTPFILDQQVKTLSEAGYTFMTNDDLNNVLDGEGQLPSKPILLTFDDGYRDFYTDALPILVKYHAKATNYLISGFLNHPNHLLDWQVREIIKTGIVEIGAHTVHHVWLKGMKPKDILTEAAQSKLALETTYGIRVNSFAYPFGAFDENAVSVTRSAGYRSAVSTIPGITQTQDNRYYLFRLRPGGRIGQDLLTWLNQSSFNAY